jgi:hypothetical protein
MLEELYKQFWVKNIDFKNKISCWKCGLPGDKCYDYFNREDYGVVLRVGPGFGEKLSEKNKHSGPGRGYVRACVSVHSGP